MDHPPSLDARGVTKTYRTGDVEVHALRGVHVAIDEAEFVVVMGPSGNGKTTLLNCLSGLDTIDAGTVLIDGSDIHRLRDGARTAHRATRMGFVFQSFNLVPVFDAVENVELPLLASGVKPRPAREKSAAMLDRVGPRPPSPAPAHRAVGRRAAAGGDRPLALLLAPVLGAGARRPSWSSARCWRARRSPRRWSPGTASTRRSATSGARSGARSTSW